MVEHRQVAAAVNASRRPVAGVGRVLLWNGGALWIGRDAGQVEVHAHHAIQVALAMGEPVLLRDAEVPDWLVHRGAVVMPHRRHQFDGCGHAVAQIFVEPETAQGRILIDRYSESGITGLHADLAEVLADPLRRAYEARASDHVLGEVARSTVAALAGPAESSSCVDPRVSRAAAWLRQRLDSRPTLSDAAAVANLSPSRFRHLFVAQTGVSFRAYLLWARVEAAVAAGMRGHSWTAAAQDAGFADSAHLSRTCRRMFGITPASLVRE